MPTVEDMFIDGIKFKKAGVEISKITKSVQTSMYQPIEKELKLARLNPVEDFNTSGFDRKRLYIAQEDYLHRDKIDLKASIVQKIRSAGSTNY